MEHLYYINGLAWLRYQHTVFLVSIYCMYLFLAHLHVCSPNHLGLGSTRTITTFAAFGQPSAKHHFGSPWESRLGYTGPHRLYPILQVLVVLIPSLISSHPPISSLTSPHHLLPSIPHLQPHIHVLHPGPSSSSPGSTKTRTPCWPRAPRPAWPPASTRPSPGSSSPPRRSDRRCADRGDEGGREWNGMGWKRFRHAAALDVWYCLVGCFFGT